MAHGHGVHGVRGLHCAGRGSVHGTLGAQPGGAAATRPPRMVPAKAGSAAGAARGVAARGCAARGVAARGASCGTTSGAAGFAAGVAARGAAGGATSGAAGAAVVAGLGAAGATSGVAR